MSILGPWVDPKIFAGAYEFSPVLNLATLAYNAELLDKSTFSQGTKINTPGVKNILLEASGFAEFGADLQDAQNFTNIGLSNIPVSLFPPSTPVVGDPAYFFQAAQAKYALGGPHGQIVPASFDAHAASGHPLARGVVLETGGTARTATFTGTGVNYGAVSATQYLYAVAHFIQAGGTSLDLIIESDDGAGFGTPVTRITFAQVTTTITAVYATRVAGAITDTWWRCKGTIAGSGPYKVAVAIGIV
jgi:hypothetical protein